MENRKGLSKKIADALRGYVSEERIDKIILTVKNHALAAGAAAGAAEVIPGGAIAATAVGLGFVLAMYYKICKELDVNLGKSKLKAIASLLIADTASYLGVLLSANVILNLVPGLNLGGAVLGIVVNFAMVYAAGVLFLLMMGRVFKAAGSKAAVAQMSEADLVSKAKETSRTEGKKISKQAFSEYKDVKDDPNTSGEGIEAMEG